MNTSQNMQDFDLCVAVVLEQLYHSFPQPKKINTWEIQAVSDPDRILVVYDEIKGLEKDAELEIENSLNNYRWALEFLYSEGIVRDIIAEEKEKPGYTYATEDQPTRGVPNRTFILTSKGLSLLNESPKSLSGQKGSLVERFTEGLKSNSKQVLKDATGAFIKALATYAVRMTLGST